MKNIKSLVPDSLLKYLLSGGLAFAVDYASLNIAFYVLGVSVVFATSVGYIAGLIISFTANRYWVHGKQGRHRKQFAQLLEYGLLVLVNYVFTVFAIKLLYGIGIPPYIGKLITMILILGWNYVIFSKIIFAANKSS